MCGNGSPGVHREGGDDAILHWPRTLAAKGCESLQPQHLHFRQRAAQDSTLHCFLLDCSASMLRHGGLVLAKAMLLSWCDQIQRNGDQALVIGFGGETAHLLLGSQGIARDRTWLDEIPAGGGTPLAAGIDMLETQLRQSRQRYPIGQSICWLLTDGRFTQLPPAPVGASSCVLVDCDESAVIAGRAAALAERWRAPCYRARELIEEPGGTAVV
ncbi:MAG: VWA domain-containing protein [Pseudomonadota bacterium]